MSDELVCGLDVGTTMVKAALFDLGRPQDPVAVAETPSPTRMPASGWSETDPRSVTAAAVASLRQVMDGRDPASVGALGISGTACGAWLVDDAGAPVRDAILWNDGRAENIVSGWARSGALERIFALSGNVPYPGYTLPVLAWLRRHEPDVLDRARTVLCCKDWLRLTFTGETASEESDASYVPMDIRARGWSDELLTICGVRDEGRLLPELRGANHVAPLTDAAADATGLAPGTPVAMGLTDIVSGTLGGGCIRPGRAVSVLGTSAVSTTILERPSFDPPVVGLNAAAPLGRWARTMVNTSGSMTLDWTARLLTGGDVSRLVQLASSATGDAAEDVVFVPYLSNAGVVAPFAEPAARGVIAGLRNDHGPADVARAAIEGLALAVADGYAVMPTTVTEITAVGGASRSDLLLEAIADSTGCVVQRLHGDGAGSRAVALLAARAAGLLSSDAELEAAIESRTIVRSFEPIPERRARRRERYARTVAATRGLWRAWR